MTSIAGYGVEIRVADELIDGPFAEQRIAPGVIGYTVEDGDATYIPLIIAEHEGNGDVGRFLDGLDRSRTWKIPTVVHDRLRGMLIRRHWKLTTEYAEEIGCKVEVFVLPARREQADDTTQTDAVPGREGNARPGVLAGRRRRGRPARGGQAPAAGDPGLA